MVLAVLLLDGARPSAALQRQFVQVDLASDVCGKLGFGVAGQESLVGGFGLGAGAAGDIRHFENENYYRK